MLQVPPEGRGQIGEALAAYASVSDPQLLANLFRVALTKYAKVCVCCSLSVLYNLIASYCPTPLPGGGTV